VRAALEAIAYRTADLIAAMERECGVPLKALRADGGAVRGLLGGRGRDTEDKRSNPRFHMLHWIASLLRFSQWLGVRCLKMIYFLNCNDPRRRFITQNGFNTELRSAPPFASLT
jgi:hypothetical protein